MRQGQRLECGVGLHLISDKVSLKIVRINQPFDGFTAGFIQHRLAIGGIELALENALLELPLDIVRARPSRGSLHDLACEAHIGSCEIADDRPQFEGAMRREHPVSRHAEDTPPNALPASGAADYQTTSTERVSTFRANYATKTITGTIPFFVNGPTLAAEFRDVTISADGTSFSGRLIPPDGSAEGTVQGRFTGPGGQEFLAQAVLKSGQSITLFSGARAP